MENANSRKPVIKKSVRKNAILNIIKQTGNICIPLISYPYVTRVLGAENFGKYSFANSIIQYVLLFSAMGINVYAIREGAAIRDDHRELQTFSDEIFQLNLFTTIGTLSVFFLIVVSSPTLKTYGIMLFIMSLNAVGQTISRDWLVSIHEDYGYITFRYLLFQAISLVLVFLFVHKSSDYLIYTVIMVAGTMCGYFSSVFYTRRYCRMNIHFSKDALTHTKPVIKLFASSLALQIYINSDVTMIGMLRSEQEVGVYTLASKIYLLLKSLLNAAITVTIPRLSNLYWNDQKDEFYELTCRLRNVLEILVYPCLIGLFALSDDVILIVGGGEYQDGYVTLKILCGALLFAVFGCLYSQGYLIPQKKDTVFVVATFVGAVANILLNIVMIPKFGINGAALTTVVSEILVCSICQSKCEISHGDASNIVSVLFSCGALLIWCILMKKLVCLLVLRIIASVFGGALIYFIILILFRNYTIMEFIEKALGNSKKH